MNIHQNSLNSVLNDYSRLENAELVGFCNFNSMTPPYIHTK